jgi:hypothetical protein
MCGDILAAAFPFSRVPSFHPTVKLLTGNPEGMAIYLIVLFSQFFLQ